MASLLTILLLIGVQLGEATLLAGAWRRSPEGGELLVSTARPWQFLTAMVAATSPHVVRADRADRDLGVDPRSLQVVTAIS